MKHIQTINAASLKASAKKGGCGQCQASCQSACKTSCTRQFRCTGIFQCHSPGEGLCDGRTLNTGKHIQNNMRKGQLLSLFSHVTN